jgi:hypothetical protein
MTMYSCTVLLNPKAEHPANLESRARPAAKKRPSRRARTRFRSANTLDDSKRVAGGRRPGRKLDRAAFGVERKKRALETFDRWSDGRAGVRLRWTGDHERSRVR